MHYREMQPAGHLAAFVRCYWTLDATAMAGSPPQRVLPDGCVEIVINLGARFTRFTPGRVEVQPSVLIVGPTTRHVSIAPTGAVRLIGIRFVPGGAVPFLAVPPREVRDEVPSLDAVAPPLEPWVLERLATAPPGTIGRILDAALGDRLSRARRTSDRRILSVVQTTLDAPRAMTVDSLVSLTGLGVRQIERAFRDTVGFGPKTLCRLTRFQRVVRAIDATERPAWARLAAHHGYADQSHLVREFREFAGTTLSAYVAEVHPMSDVFVGQ